MPIGNNELIKVLASIVGNLKMEIKWVCQTCNKIYFEEDLMGYRNRYRYCLSCAEREYQAYATPQDKGLLLPLYDKGTN